VAVGIWVFLWTQIKEKDEYQKQLDYLTVSGLILAGLSIVTFMIPANKLPIVWPKEQGWLVINQGWSLTGSLLAEVVLLGLLVWEWGGRLLEKLKKEEGSGYIKEAVLTAILMLGGLLGFYKLYKTGWAVLDWNSSWVIAVEAFKHKPLLGAGVGNFAEAFSIFRPVSYNLGRYWSSGFNFSGMGWLHIWTELGVVGLGMMLILIRGWFGGKKDSSWWEVGLLGLVLLILPLNGMSLMLLMWIGVMKVSQEKESRLVLRVGESGMNVMPGIVAVMLVGMSGFGGYWITKALEAEIIMRQSLVAAAKNDGKATYDWQVKAIGWNPYMAEYRKIYSQTNLAIAQNILSKKEPSEEEKQQASVLLQQAVREGKSAVSLEPANANYWVNLASIYRAMAGILDGAADWSYQAYNQAVGLDPMNPMIKMELGGLLFAANRFEEADRVFEEAVLNKKDLANSWYNWAYNAKKMNRLGEAVNRMNQAVALVPVDSGDYDKASKELADWKKELDEIIKKQQEQLKAQQAANEEKKPESLKTPEPLPTAGKEERVEVPKEGLEPPKTTPVPTMSVKPSVSVSPTTKPPGGN
jgi:Tfp pilus assembly protein PilF